MYIIQLSNARKWKDSSVQNKFRQKLTINFLKTFWLCVWKCFLWNWKDNSNFAILILTLCQSALCIVHFKIFWRHVPCSYMIHDLTAAAVNTRIVHSFLQCCGCPYSIPSSIEIYLFHFISAERQRQEEGQGQTDDCVM